jgi:hypothetical protein
METHNWWLTIISYHLNLHENFSSHNYVSYEFIVNLGETGLLESCNFFQDRPLPPLTGIKAPLWIRNSDPFSWMDWTFVESDAQYFREKLNLANFHVRLQKRAKIAIAALTSMSHDCSQSGSEELFALKRNKSVPTDSASTRSTSPSRRWWMNDSSVRVKSATPLPTDGSRTRERLHEEEPGL